MKTASVIGSSVAMIKRAPLLALNRQPSLLILNCSKQLHLHPLGG
jgi:hypothetical protein